VSREERKRGYEERGSTERERESERVKEGAGREERKRR
jgi:hypothetical protein